MAIVYEQMLKSSINSGNIKNTYFIFGNDAYLKQMYVDKITYRCVDKDDEFNIIKYECDCDLQQVYNSIEEFPLMADKKCVLLCDYNFLDASKSDFDKLMEMLSNPCDTTVFIMWFNDMEFDAKKCDRAKKLITATEKAGGFAVQIDHRSTSDLRKMLMDGALKRGCAFQSGVADYLIEACGDDINTLKNELEKLYAYVGNGEISRDTVDTVAVKSVEASVYDLSKEIFALNLNRALALLDELFYKRTEAEIIFHSIFSVFVDVYRVYAAKGSGINNAEIAKTFGYGNRDFVINRAARHAANMDRNKIKLCFDELLNAHATLRAFGADSRVILESLVVRLVYILSKGEKID